MNRIKRIFRMFFPKNINPRNTQYVRCPHCATLYHHEDAVTHVNNSHNDFGWK